VWTIKLLPDVTAACSLKTENVDLRTREVRSRCVFKLPFGEELGAGTGSRSGGQGYGASDTNRWKYGMLQRDAATGLDHAGWRKYESFSGRWTSPDPYGLSASIADPQSFNRYPYTQNDPVNFVDPSGLDDYGLGPPPPVPTLVPKMPTGPLPIIRINGPGLYLSGHGAGGLLGDGNGTRGLLLDVGDDPQNRSDTKGDKDIHPPQVDGKPRPPGLPTCLMNYLAKFFDPSMLSAITWSNGIPWYVPMAADAFTLDDHIYVDPSAFDPSDGIQLSEILLIGHEATHVRQYRQNGSLRMKGKYLINSAVMGAAGSYAGGMAVGFSFASYYGNKFEKEAYQMQEKIKNDLAKNGNPCP
jgi:RHS repeat-associated protein